MATPVSVIQASSAAASVVVLMQGILAHYGIQMTPDQMVASGTLIGYVFHYLVALKILPALPTTDSVDAPQATVSPGSGTH